MRFSPDYKGVDVAQALRDFKVGLLVFVFA